MNLTGVNGNVITSGGGVDNPDVEKRGACKVIQRVLRGERTVENRRWFSESRRGNVIGSRGGSEFTMTSSAREMKETDGVASRDGVLLLLWHVREHISE